jgi:ABC-type glucose/galactose transport system permease subunit
MNEKAQLVIGILLLAVAFPGGVWVVWRDLRSGKTTLIIGNGKAIGGSRGIDATRNQSPCFYWFTVCIYTFGALVALCLGISAVADFIEQ